MFSAVLTAEGSPSAIGRQHGAALGTAIRHNLRRMAAAWAAMGLSPAAAREAALAAEPGVRVGRLEEIAGIAGGAGLDYADVLALNLWYPVLFPDECSVVVAHGRAGAADGRTLFFKNSDKVGGAELSGAGFYRGKEINVLVYVRPQGLPAYMGVAAAGTTGLKFGCSERGIAVGTNIARTVQLRDKSVSLNTVRAADRADLARVALEEETARAAAQRVSALISEAPMGTPGNMEFVDAEAAWFLEGSYDRQALTWGRDAIFVRTNRFELFHELNDPEDVSSHARYVRAMELVRPLAGRVEVATLIGVSTDHVNGPGLSSLCRHDPDPRNETSLSAGIVEITPGDAAGTVFHVALGKPCRAWTSPNGHTTLSFRQPPEAAPPGFYDGQVWVDHYSEA